MSLNQEKRIQELEHQRVERDRVIAELREQIVRLTEQCMQLEDQVKEPPEGSQAMRDIPAQCMQTHTIQEILELRLGMTPHEAQGQLMQLTPQERKVLQAMVLGQTTQTIARSLRIKPHSVEKYKYILYQKLAVSGETDAVLEALLADIPIF